MAFTRSKSAAELIADQKKYQSWRTEEDTVFVVNENLGELYCDGCHDWHTPDEAHSLRLVNGQWI